MFQSRIGPFAVRNSSLSIRPSAGEQSEADQRPFSNALSARSPSRLRPEFWIACGMQDSKDDNALWFDTEKDGVRKLRKNGTPHFTVYTRKHFRIALDGIECGINGGQEAFAKTFALPFVIPESSRKIPPHLPTVDNWQRHQPRRASASTWSRETTSSGLRSCSAKHSSITNRWASPKGTEDGSAARLSQMISARRRRSSGESFRISATSVSLIMSSVPLLFPAR